MVIYNIKVLGFEDAIRGMRNPRNSWWLSDSSVDNNEFTLGDDDFKLLAKLVRGGAEHRKVLRQIQVNCEIIAPLYWWKQFDTYKVGVSANSTSTMNSITRDEFRPEMFELSKDLEYSEAFQAVIKELNELRELYLEDSGYKQQAFMAMIQLLPSSYLQLRTITMTYEALLNICMQRKGHKLPEWKSFVKAMKSEVDYLSVLMNKARG